MSLGFRAATTLRPGQLYQMLCRSYNALLTGAGPEKSQRYLMAWQNFDDAIFNFPDTVGACAKVSYLEGKPASIGLLSWDPRGFPDVGIMGQNCVLPEFRGKGYGRQQIMEIVRLFQQGGYRRIEVETGTDDFFHPARRMYASLGFTECSRGYNEYGDGIVRYQRDLEKPT